jgi:hypothetical protein
MGRLVWGTLMIVAMVATASAKNEDFNVDMSIGWAGCYRPGQWTPVEIGIGRQATEPFGGTVTLSAMQDMMTSMSISHPIVVAKDQPARLPLVTKVSLGATRCDLTITGRDGRNCCSLEYDLGRFYTNSRPYTAVFERDILIGVCGKRPFGLARLERNSDSTSAKFYRNNTYSGNDGNDINNKGKVYVKDKLVELLPWDWTGYTSLDTLILCNAQWDTINPQQARAISQWVSNGGRLLLVVGASPMPDKGPIAQMLPFRLVEFKKSPMPDRFLPAGNSPRAASMPAEATLTHWSLDQASSAGWAMESFGGREDLLASAAVGFGKVAVLAFDPADLPPADDMQSATFWADCLKVLLDQREIHVVKDAPQKSNDNWYGEQSRSSLSTNLVMEHLLSIPELRPLSIWWVIGLLAFLAVLLGPIDYMVLKRIDRLPFTWITSAVIIAIFTVGAYFGVKALRAGAMQVRAVSVIDSIQAGPTWATTYCGIFAPDSDDYRLDQMGQTQWWSGISPGQNYGYYNDESIVSRKIHYIQQDGKNTPWSVPINIWSMQCLISESDMPHSPISAQIIQSPQGPCLKITNNTPAKILGMSLLDMTGRVVTDSLAGGQSTTVPLKKDGSDLSLGGDGRFEQYFQPVSGFLGMQGYIPNANRGINTAAMALDAQGCDQRSQSIADYARNGAIIVQAEFEAAPLPFGLAGCKYDVNHVQYARLVIPASLIKASINEDGKND